MSLPHPLRKKLGSIKARVFDQWPYRGHVKAIPAKRAALRPALEKLRPLPATTGCEFEIHMLCGKRDLDMGIWASWSMLRYLDGRACLFVHSDGSLSDEDVSVWKAIVGNVVVVHRAESDEIVRENLNGRAPLLYEWRCSNWASAQLVDVHFFGTARQILIMDSDVLTFLPPDEVIEALLSSVRRFGWCEDLRQSYSSDADTLKDVTGVSVASRLCAGFLISPRCSVDDFLELEGHLRLIEEDPRIDIGHFWSCQTYYALMAGKCPASEMFSSLYANTSGKTGGAQVLRHYVGIPRVRYRYFDEGIPRILGQEGMLST